MGINKTLILGLIVVLLLNIVYAISDPDTSNNFMSMNIDVVEAYDYRISPKMNFVIGGTI